MAVRHIQKVEAGEVNATLDTLAALAEALGVNGANLLTAEPEQRPRAGSRASPARDDLGQGESSPREARTKRG